MGGWNLISEWREKLVDDDAAVFYLVRCFAINRSMRSAKRRGMVIACLKYQTGEHAFACCAGRMPAIRRPDVGAPGTLKAKSRCSQPKLLAAQSLTYKPPKWSVRWQPGLAKHKLPICIPTSIGGRYLPVGTRSVSTSRLSLAGHSVGFHQSHIPCGAWCR
jgi:hypothetical protein